MTDPGPLIKAFVKTLEEANTSTQFECFTPKGLRTVMGSVVGWEAMRVIGDGSRNDVVRTLTGII